MQKPNQFDKDYESKLDSKAPEDVLAEIARDPRVVTRRKRGR